MGCSTPFSRMESASSRSEASVELAPRLLGVRLEGGNRRFSGRRRVGLSIAAEKSVDPLAEGFLRH